jgi:hypothetical protein
MFPITAALMAAAAFGALRLLRQASAPRTGVSESATPHRAGEMLKPRRNADERG